MEGKKEEREGGKEGPTGEGQGSIAELKCFENLSVKQNRPCIIFNNHVLFQQFSTKIYTRIT